MKSVSTTRLTLSICALVGGVFISSAVAKPFKLFGHDRDRDREEEAEGKVYIITDGPAPPGSTGIVHVVPASPQGIVPTPEGRTNPPTEQKSRKSKSGETRYLERVEPAEIPAERITGEAPVIRRAEPVEDTHEQVTTTKKRETPVRTSRSSTSQKSSAQVTRKKVQQPDRDDEEEARPQISIIRQKEREDAPITSKRETVEEPQPTKRQVVDESAIPKRETVEESSSVVRSHDNPLMPNPAATEERKPLVPAEVPAPRQETTVRKEVTTSHAPGVQEAPPEQQAPQVQQVDEKVSSTPTPEVPRLTAASDYASASGAAPETSSGNIAPANLPSGKIEKAGSKRNTADIPVAEKTDKPGFVNTPFTPKKLIDVRGMASGSLAKDPSTNKVFRVP